ncbi:MAG TPA: glutaredoxin domain-containing protein [bacterium]|nr:glutaredoxin domain-containing protein [bacterium]HPL95561.1 glutaredoxin domain-containing protein [bacterium]
MSQPQVTIYSTPYCGYCQLAKQYLTEKGIAYTEIDVSENEAAQQEMINKTKQMGVPVIIIKTEEIIIGFQKDKLNHLLNIN